MVRLTDRDQALVRALGRFRLARSGAMGRLFFPGRNRDVLVSRLRKLFDGGYLDAHAPERAAENIYPLGSRGRASLREQGIRVGSVPRPPWDHHLGIVDFWAKIATATHGLGDMRLSTFLPEWELREGLSWYGSEVIPDALAELRGTSADSPEVIRLAVELDRGTEGLAVLERKLQDYAQAHVVGLGPNLCKEFVLILVLDGRGLERERRVRDLLEAQGISGAHLWTGDSDLVEEIDALGGHSRNPVPGSRYRDGSLPDATQGAALPSDVTGEGLSDD